MRIDGEVHKYTKLWNIVGAQKAKRKRDWVEVEIVVPETWWREPGRWAYKNHLAREIEKGLHSMIELLRRNKHEIRAEKLLEDWHKVKVRYLSNPGDPSDTKVVQ